MTQIFKDPERIVNTVNFLKRSYNLELVYVFNNFKAKEQPFFVGLGCKEYGNTRKVFTYYAASPDDIPNISTEYWRLENTEQDKIFNVFSHHTKITKEEYSNWIATKEVYQQGEKEHGWDLSIL